jgi:hypothetical protein
MLNNLNKLLLKCFIWTWIAHWLSSGCGHVIARLCRFSQVSQCQDFSYDAYALFVALVSLLVSWKYLRSEFNSDQKLWDNSRFEIFQDFYAIRFVRLLAVSLSSLVILFFALFFVSTTAEHSKVPLACAAEFLGQDSLSELIFCSQDLSRFRFPYDSLAVWQSSWQTETIETRQRRNNTVAKFYGPDSLYMARRYYYIGTNLEMNADVRGKPYPLECKYWFAKALAISRKHNDCELTLLTLCQLTLYSDFSETRELLSEASRNLTGARSPDHDNYLELLSYIATKVKEPELAHSFKARLNILRSAARKCKPDYFESKVKYGVLMLSLAFSVGAGFGLFKECLLCLMYTRYSSQLSCSTSDTESSRLLNGLISLDLYRGNIDRAMSNSSRLLNLVGIATSTPACLNFDDWKNRRLKRIAWEQVHAAAFVAVFLAFWIF